MKALNPYHPVNMVAGMMLAAGRLAKRTGQTSLALSCKQAFGWALETKESIREIATDAEYALDRVLAAKADGIITLEEIEEINQILLQLRDEAVNGGAKQ